MKIGKTLYVHDPKDWRKWLAKHHDTLREIWLIYPKKHTGKPRIGYEEAVEQALCYGWIDSTVKRIDRDSYAQRFSPRRPGSVLSQPNRERIKGLIATGKMTRAGLSAVAHAYRPKAVPVGSTRIPPAISRAMRANPAAWKNFRRLPAGYRRVRIAFVESRKRHGMAQYRKSLAHFVSMTARNKKFGIFRP